MLSWMIADDSIADLTMVRGRGAASRIRNERFSRDHSGNGMMGNDNIVVGKILTGIKTN